jgi:hypothetical protein
MLLREFLFLVQKLRPVFFQKRVYLRALALAFGTLCTLGRRTIARVLAAMGKDQQDWSNDYRLFSRSKWKSADLFVPVIEEALTHCPGTGHIALAGDFTHVPKTGKHIPQVTCMRDPMSPHFHVNLIYGLRFFQVSALCPFRDHKPEALPARSVPICFETAPVTKKPGKKATEEDVAAYKKACKEKLSAKAARQELEELRVRFDEAGAAERRLLATLDGGFCNRVFFEKAFDRIDLIARCRKDAVLCFQAPQQEGSRRFYGKQKFTPEEVNHDKSRPWTQENFFYGGKWHSIKFKEVDRVLWQGGTKRRMLRLIVISPLGYHLHKHGKMLYRKPAYFLSDDLSTPASELIAAYLDHWQIEVNHREEKTTLGLGQAQVRNKRSVPRQPAFVVACYAMLLLASLRAYGPERTKDYLPPAKWARDSKRPSCQDMIALLRAQMLTEPREDMPEEIQISAMDLLLKAAA